MVLDKPVSSTDFIALTTRSFACATCAVSDEAPSKVESSLSVSTSSWSLGSVMAEGVFDTTGVLKLG